MLGKYAYFIHERSGRKHEYIQTPQYLGVNLPPGNSGFCGSDSSDRHPEALPQLILSVAYSTLGQQALNGHWRWTVIFSVGVDSLSSPFHLKCGQTIPLDPLTATDKWEFRQEEESRNLVSLSATNVGKFTPDSGHLLQCIFFPSVEWGRCYWS